MDREDFWEKSLQGKAQISQEPRRLDTLCFVVLPCARVGKIFIKNTFSFFIIVIQFYQHERKELGNLNLKAIKKGANALKQHNIITDIYF